MPRSTLSSKLRRETKVNKVEIITIFGLGKRTLIICYSTHGIFENIEQGNCMLLVECKLHGKDCCTLKG